MTILDRDLYLRNHVMGVLVSYTNKGLSYSNMSELADDITQSVIEGDRKWHEENCLEQLRAISNEDVPQ